MRITSELAVAWATLPVAARPDRWAVRLGMVRGFAKYLATIDPASEIPSVDLLKATQPRLAPHIFTDQEITDLMDAARRLAPVLRGASAETVIGLLAATGLRIGEALALDRDHVELDEGVIVVNAGKSEQREVLLHDTTTAALDRYARLRDRIVPAPADQEAIDRIAPAGTPPGRYQPPDGLLAFLDRLSHPQRLGVQPGQTSSSASPSTTGGSTSNRT